MVEGIVRLNVQLTAKEGHLEEFKSIAESMTEATRAEAGALGYEWFSDGGSRFRLHETYTGVEAIQAHFMGPAVREWVPKLAAVCTIDGFEVYGDPGPQVSGMVAGFGAQIFQYWIGLNR